MSADIGSPCLGELTMNSSEESVLNEVMNKVEQTDRETDNSQVGEQENAVDQVCVSPLVSVNQNVSEELKSEDSGSSVLWVLNSAMDIHEKSLNDDRQSVNCETDDQQSVNQESNEQAEITAQSIPIESSVKVDEKSDKIEDGKCESLVGFEGVNPVNQCVNDSQNELVNFQEIESEGANWGNVSGKLDLEKNGAKWINSTGDNNRETVNSCETVNYGNSMESPRSLQVPTPKSCVKKGLRSQK